MDPTPCIHTRGHGLCPQCRAAAELDPAAWEEYGEHPAGLANWQALQDELLAAAAARAAGPAVADADLPF